MKSVQSQGESQRVGKAFRVGELHMSRDRVLRVKGDENGLASDCCNLWAADAKGACARAGEGGWTCRICSQATARAQQTKMTFFRGFLLAGTAAQEDAGLSPVATAPSAPPVASLPSTVLFLMAVAHVKGPHPARLEWCSTVSCCPLQLPLRQLRVERRLTHPQMTSHPTMRAPSPDVCNPPHARRV